MHARNLNPINDDCQGLEETLFLACLERRKTKPLIVFLWIHTEMERRR